MRSNAKNPFLIDEEQDKENFFPLWTPPVSERPTQLPVLMKSRPSRTRIENFPDYVYEKIFE